MRRRHAWRVGAIAAAALALLFAVAPSASARKLQMSGTWAVRTGFVFLPLQFAQSLMGSQMTHTSMGDLSKGFGFPNGPIPGEGRVNATGSSPATLVVPRHRFRTQSSPRLPFEHSVVVQVTTMFVIDGPFDDAVLAPGAGPGSFTWCPNDVLGCRPPVRRGAGSATGA